MVTMILGGLWHGANMTFVIWGVYQGTLLCMHKVWCRWGGGFWVIEKLKKTRLYKIVAGLVTFLLVCYGWLIFRVESFDQLIQFNIILFNTVGEIGDELIYPSTLLNVIWLLLIVQFIQWRSGDLMVIYNSKKWVLRGLFYILLVYFILEGIIHEKQDFIYFQF